MFMSIAQVLEHFDDIECDDRSGDNQWLASFKSIYPSQNVNGIGTEDSQHSHVNVIQKPYKSQRNPLKSFHGSTRKEIAFVPMSIVEPSTFRTNIGNTTFVRLKFT